MTPTEYLDHIFAEFPPAQKLLREVRDFYGPVLRIELTDNPNGVSGYGIDLGQQTLCVSDAVIRLNTTTDRIAAAATHELLHLVQPIRGFNVICTLSPGPFHRKQMAHVQTVLHKIENIIHHDIFLDEFLATGLPLSQFMVEGRRVIPKYKAEARSYRGTVLTKATAWYAWSWWMFEFLNNHIAIRHGDQEAQAYAGSTEKFGSRVLPKFKHETKRIREWVAAGKHRQPDSYMDAIRSLIGLLHLPRVQTFGSLQRADGTAPRVVPIA